MTMPLISFLNPDCDPPGVLAVGVPSSGAVPQEPRRRATCAACETPLQRPPMQPGQPVAIEHCKKCGSACFVAAGNEPPEPPSDRRSLGPFEPRLRDDLLRGLLGPVLGEGERRVAPRYAITVPVTVVRIDPNTGDCGMAMPMLTKNLSRSGACLLSEAKIEDGLLVIDFSPNGNEGKQLAMHVVRCRKLCGHYEVAGKFA